MLRTNVDRLLELLKEKKEQSVKDVAKILGMPEKTVEKIAKYLEEEDILIINYKFMTPNLILKDPEKIPQLVGEWTDQKAGINPNMRGIKPEAQDPKINDYKQARTLKKINKMINIIKSDIGKGKIKAGAAKYNYMRDIYNKKLNDQNKSTVYSQIMEIYSYFKEKEGGNNPS